MTSSTTTSTMASVVDPSQIIGFLKEYRVLECSGCGNVFGFQHRNTGAMYCIGGCHQSSSCTPKPQLPIPNGISTSRLNANASQLNSNYERRDDVRTQSSLDKCPVLVEKETPRAAPQKTPTPTPLVNGFQKSDPPGPGKISSSVGFDAIDGGNANIPEVKNDLRKELVTPTSKPAAPVQPTSNRLSWNKCVYSPNLKSNELVRVQFVWNPTTYQVVAEKDEDSLGTFQEKIKAYATKAKPGNYTPQLDDMVIGKYDGEFYRAKVSKVDGTSCELVFVDYGDKKTCQTAEVIPVDDAIMKHPIYGLTIHLDKLPEDCGATKLNSELEDHLYTKPFILDLCTKGNVAPGESAHYDCRLWDSKMENTLNESVRAVLRGWAPLTAEERIEIAYLANTNTFFRETKKIVEDAMLQSLSSPEKNNYVFRLDNCEYRYRLVDMPLVPAARVNDILEVEITQFYSIGHVIVRPCSSEFEMMHKQMSERISAWISKSAKANPIDPQYTPVSKEMFLVKWPRWEEVNYEMEAVLRKEWWRDFVNEIQKPLSIFEDDYAQYSGKWFRASYQRVYYMSPEDTKETTMFKMLLVDIGKTTLIPTKYVYKMPHRFMIDYQMTMFLSIRLNEITQFSKEVDERWKFLLLPGMKIKIKVIWMFDEVNIVQLIQPTETQFERHFRQPVVQEQISVWKEQKKDHERHQKVKKMSTLKGSFAANMNKVLAEEAAEAKLQPLRDEYSGIGRVHPDCIFELRIPNPVPPQYRETNS